MPVILATRRRAFGRALDAANLGAHRASSVPSAGSPSSRRAAPGVSAVQAPHQVLRPAGTRPVGGGGLVVLDILLQLLQFFADRDQLLVQRELLVDQLAAAAGAY